MNLRMYKSKSSFSIKTNCIIHIIKIKNYPVHYTILWNLFLKTYCIFKFEKDNNKLVTFN